MLFFHVGLLRCSVVINLGAHPHLLVRASWRSAGTGQLADAALLPAFQISHILAGCCRTDVHVHVPYYCSFVAGSSVSFFFCGSVRTARNMLCQFFTCYAAFNTRSSTRMKACAFNVLIVTKQVSLPCLPEMQLPRLCWQGSARSDEGLAVPRKAGVSRGCRWNEVTCVTRSRFWSAFGRLQTL
jgi:hypothetical protein